MNDPNDPAGKISPVGVNPRTGKTSAQNVDRNRLKDLAARALNNTTLETAIAPLEGFTMAVKPGWKAITAHLVWVMLAEAEAAVSAAVVVEGDK